MKFIDVIKNMKVGEAYKCTDNKCDISYIRKGEKGIEFGLGYNIFRVNIIPDDTEFELERKEYNFTEAFNSFKDGHTIQSVSSKIIYYMTDKFEVVAEYDDSKAYYLCSDSLFTYNEISGKWYILD